eukprot:2679876-Pyramimonas_sp.AAC.1
MVDCIVCFVNVPVKDQQVCAECNALLNQLTQHEQDFGKLEARSKSKLTVVNGHVSEPTHVRQQQTAQLREN